MFENDEWLAIIKKLIELTRAEAAKWSLGDVNVLRSEVEGTEYEIGSVDNDGRAPYFLAIYTGEGFDREELARIESDPGEFENYTPGEAVTDLQRIANRMARGGPQLASKLLADMEKILPSPKTNEPWNPPSSNAPWEETPF